MKEGWNYIAVKKLPELLRGTMSKHNVDYYCLNCLHLPRMKKNVNQVCENKDFCNVAMPSEDTKILV